MSFPSKPDGSGRVAPRQRAALTSMAWLLRQWDFTRNKGLHPGQVALGSNRLVWWVCSKGPDHVWRARPSHRRDGRGCPFCAGRRASVTNSLAALYPETAAEWCQARNGSITPGAVVAGSMKLVWWKCRTCGCEWQECPRDRSLRRHACPECTGRHKSSLSERAVTFANRLDVRFPDLAKEFDIERNGGVRPDAIAYGSGRKVWWACAKHPDHVWRASPNQRTRGGRSGSCPFCRGSRPSSTHNLALLFPRAAAEWDAKKNGSLTPAQVRPSSAQKVWWRCAKDPAHAWQTSIYHRTRNRSGCPYCAGRRLTLSRSLGKRFPELARQWHPTKNGRLTPWEVAAHFKHQVWWKCDKAPDHVWKASPTSRIKGVARGCPFCSSHRIALSNSLAKLAPGIAAQWHPTLNGELAPDKIGTGSRRKVWWKCGRNPRHAWQATVAKRVHAAHGCPLCSNHRVGPDNSLAAKHPKLAAEWHPTKNGELTANMVVPGCSKRAWWKCDKGADHEWQTIVFHRAKNGSGCPFCANDKVSVTNSLATRFPGVAAMWHPKKNGALTPEGVVATSERRVWWKCPKAEDHEWSGTVAGRTSGTGECPFCSGQRVAKSNSLAMRFPEVAAQWHASRNGKLKPSAVHSGSGMRVWWKCRNGPDHEWLTSVSHRTRLGTRCPYCLGIRFSVTHSLAWQFPKLVREWHTHRNAAKPTEVASGSAYKAWWRCARGHAWQARVSDRTAKARGCPACATGSD